MSETDDTDVLLLIPPNFFLVKSSGSDDSLLESSRTVVHKPRSCTAQVIGKLVNQVQTLESRLDSLEISTDHSNFSSKSVRRALDTTDSFESQSLDRKCFTFPRRRRRKAVRKDTLREHSLTSLDSLSTNGKAVPPLQLDAYKCSYGKPVKSINDTISMDGDISSIVSTPSQKTDKLLLNEIDEFLTKVESYESPDSKYKDGEGAASPENIIKATGQYLCQKFGSKHNDEDQIKLPSGRIVNSHILDKYIYLVKNNGTSPHQDKSIPSTSGYRNLDSSVNQTMESTKQDVFKPPQAKSPSIRKLNFADKDVQPTSTPKRTTQSYLDSFRPTSNKIYDRATKVLEQYKAQNSRQTEQSTSESIQKEFKMPQMRPFVENKDCFRANKLLDSIDTDLLSLSELWGEKAEQERVDRVDSIKLEEERLKREHCESIIQQLQKKILEQQEKLAVAIRVDRSKDAAIARLKEAWLKLTGSLDKAEERHRAALENMVREVENFKVVADDTQKKTNHFETELYKALDLAHDYQEKCKQLALEKKQLQDSMERELAEKQEVVDSKGRELETLKENYETVMRLNKQSTDCVRNLEDALEKERSEHNQTKLALSELTRKLQSAGDNTALVAQERDTLRDKVTEERARCSMIERQLADKQDLASELLKKFDTLDAENKSLRKLMELQKAELKTHYQKQLEDAVLSKLQEFQGQLDRASRELERHAAEKEHALVDTFNKQFSRIEEQHKLEVNILEEKQREEIKLYRLQLAQASEKIGLLESKLESYRRRRGQIASQLHGVMEAQWRQALLILTHGGAHNVSRDTARRDEVSTPMPTDCAPPKLPLTLPQFSPLGGGDSEPGAPPRAPGGGGRFNFEELSDHELQHYVKLLLTKPPNLSTPDAVPPPRELEEPTSDRPDKERKDKVKRSLNNSKPPWKA